MRITTFYSNTYFIFVAIRETVGTLTESTDSTNTIKRIYVCQYHQKQDKKCPLPDNKERSKRGKNSYLSSSTYSSWRLLFRSYQSFCDRKNRLYIPAGTCFPVNRTVIIPLYILFNLLKLRMMPNPANTFYSQFCLIITYCQQFILMEHQI